MATPHTAEQRRSPAVAVLVPAHNESSGLLPTLVNIQSQLNPGDRVLVVADNCSDDTAAVAISGGADVVERHDPTKRGKGYALDWGIRHLSSNPPEIVIIVDADCKLADGALDALALTCTMTGRPVQALYLMTTPIDSQINHQVAEFSWRVKNWLRPLGLRALNLPCQLMGTGMAFPWDVIRLADIGNAQIVEDLKLGLDLTLARHPPIFCPSARVTSEFASSAKGAGTQRKRWEQGHLGTSSRPLRAYSQSLSRGGIGICSQSPSIWRSLHYPCLECSFSEPSDYPYCMQSLAIPSPPLLSTRPVFWLLRWPRSLRGSNAAAMSCRPALFCLFQSTLLESSRFIVNFCPAKSIRSGPELIARNNQCRFAPLYSA